MKQRQQVLMSAMCNPNSQFQIRCSRISNNFRNRRKDSNKYSEATTAAAAQQSQRQRQQTINKPQEETEEKRSVLTKMLKRTHTNNK